MLPTLCFTQNGSGPSIPLISPWHFTVKIVVLLHYSHTVRLPPARLCALSSTPACPISTTAPSAGTRLRANTGGLSVTEQSAGQVENDLLAHFFEGPGKVEPPPTSTENGLERRSASFCFFIRGVLVSTACRLWGVMFLTKTIRRATRAHCVKALRLGPQ